MVALCRPDEPNPGASNRGSTATALRPFACKPRPTFNSASVRPTRRLADESCARAVISKAQNGVPRTLIRTTVTEQGFTAFSDG